MNGKRLAKSILTVVGFILAVVVTIAATNWLGITEEFKLVALVIMTVSAMTYWVYLLFEIWEDLR